MLLIHYKLRITNYRLVAEHGCTKILRDFVFPCSFVRGPDTCYPLPVTCYPILITLYPLPFLQFFVNELLRHILFGRFAL